ncbi:MAG: hypothetical protein VX957_02475, partial [Candidatus Neomarinimicrobiota bacterium]|nr:hypothetical protein [Candidatus Neomarinimicrobiota bacterium]
MKWLNHLFIYLLLHGAFIYGEQLFFEDFSGGSLPDGWTMEGRWEIGTGFGDYNTTPPGMLYVWYPSSSSGSDPYDHYMLSPNITLEGESTVLVQFDFALDGWPSTEHTNGMIIEYNSGSGWVPVLSYEISPADGSTVDIPRRMESFYADINGSVQLRFHAYGTNSYYIDAWIFDNIEILTVPQLSNISISSNNSIGNQTAIPGDNITLTFTSPVALSGLPYVQINGTEVVTENTSDNSLSSQYSVQDDDSEGPISFSIDFT